MRYIQTLNGIWNFSFTGKNRPEQPFKTDHVMTVPGCFDLIEPFCGKRGYALYTRKVHASGLQLLEIDGAGISGEVFWDGEKIGTIRYAYMPESFVFNAGDHGEHTLAIVLNNCHSGQFQADCDFFANGGIDHMLYPIHGICNLCGMEFKGYVYTGGVSYQLRTDEASLSQIKAKACEHAKRVISLINTI